MKFSILNPNKKIKPRVKPSENAIFETITPQVIKEEIVEELKPVKKGKK
jgi:hypothetical protein